MEAIESDEGLEDAEDDSDDEDDDDTQSVASEHMDVDDHIADEYMERFRIRVSEIIEIFSIATEAGDTLRMLLRSGTFNNMIRRSYHRSIYHGLLEQSSNLQVRYVQHVGNMLGPTFEELKLDIHMADYQADVHVDSGPSKGKEGIELGMRQPDVVMIGARDVVIRVLEDLSVVELAIEDEALQGDIVQTFEVYRRQIVRLAHLRGVSPPNLGGDQGELPETRQCGCGDALSKCLYAIPDLTEHSCTSGWKENMRSLYDLAGEKSG
ncbi:hypothetical protein CNMCM5793_008175 [Aspergillus hiratsukae]|uniref:Uncharacterized protein n=1 Tax=Aspergillus hiratsukae TaxID=1194566 RepID=A0A8H6P6S4_9EURO|nr:hypothetical protein CNMCM5793_008175 [Aspergillus hiratsukae]KAF7170512.1 hypothetical protein CNMCM6106_005160 [Aspergillus hiratsukae]